MGDDRALITLGQRVLALVQRASPRAEAHVALKRTHRAHTRFARNQLTTSGENDELELSLTVQVGLRSSSATTNQAQPRALEQLVERVVASVRLSPELPETMPVLGRAAFAPVDLFDPALAALPPAERAAGIAAAMEPGVRDDLQVAGYLELVSGAVAAVSSAGLAVALPFTDARFSVTARTQDGTGSGWASLATRRKGELALARVGRVAAGKARASTKPRALEPGRYTVILEPAATQELVGYLFWSLDRRAADEGRSCFSGAPGLVGSPLVTLRSDPSSPETPMLPWDPEGLPRAARTWVDRGALSALQVSRYWAKKQGLPPSGRHDGVALAAGTSTPGQLLSGVKRGVLVTRLWYSNLVDPKTLLITALTRDGTFLVEDGAIAGPVKNFRINQSVLEALRRVDAVGSATERPTATTWSAPALRTHDFLLASVSDAV